jgi:PAS domain S-box-containing protein
MAYEETFDIPGVPTHWYTQISPVVVDGEVEQIVGATRDITERKEREQRLELRETAIEEAPVGITIAERARPGTSIIYANDRFETLTGYGESEITGRSWSFLAGPETDGSRLAELTTAVENGETTTDDLVWYRQDGTPFWCRTGLAPVAFGDDEVTHYIGFHQDITEAKEYEQWIERRFDEFSDVLSEDLGEPLEQVRTQVARARENGDDDALDAAEQWLDRAEALLDDLTTVHSFSVKPRELSEETIESKRDQR